ncbi:protein kinase domain-containing protein [Streptomyces spirodelae]|uniref:Protein kinase n=1 Tax=Streptomyces spirodelae TaxID=2812904 RepID=A0ABS3WP12_9ACTN|nr:protein kinase [Streptomyces spirodelae]MBO8184840.1 protein kinase [Streptomyces spirodelae]
MTDPFGMGVFALSGELRRLGPYRLLGQLATGGMGVIYLGRHPDTGRIVAVKTLLAPGGVTEEARKRFGRETRLARRVRSTYTARVIDSDVEAERPWMAMEYVPAPSLEALVVQKGPLGDEEAVRWIAPGILRALAELHGKGIVHRDVKPLNILLTAQGPKVIDFGISHASDLTSTRLTLGTIAFASPEQAEGQASTFASDIYALGVTLYYVACGRLPYPATQEPLQQLNYVRRAAIDLDGLPAGLTGVVGDCLAVRPDDRPTAEQLIRRFAGGSSRVLPSGWTSLIDQYAEEGSRLQRAADQAEAETVTRSWTSDAPGHTRRVTQDGPSGARRRAAGAGANDQQGSNRPGNNRQGSNRSGNNRSGSDRPGNNRPPGPGRSQGSGTTPPRGTGPGSNGSSPGRVAAGVATAVGAVVLAALLLSDRDDSPSSETNSQARPTYSASRSLPDYTPRPDYPTAVRSDDTDSTDTGPAENDDGPEADESSRPTARVPDRTSAPPPAPPSNFYGAIAVGRDGSNGRSWDYRSRSAAEQGAMSRCTGPSCKVLVSFANGCGAVAYNPNSNHYWGGHGSTRAAAERAALGRAGGGRTVAWACTRR